MIRFAAITILALSSIACVPRRPVVTAPFEPRSSVGFAPTVHRAVVVYQDDVATLMAAGAHECGTIEADGTAGDDDHINDVVATFAATRGGTHVARVQFAGGREYAGSSGTVTTAYGNTAYTSGTNARYRNTNHVVFLVLVVPVADWGRLAPPMLPAEATLSGATGSAAAVIETTTRAPGSTDAGALFPSSTSARDGESGTPPLSTGGGASPTTSR